MNREERAEEITNLTRDGVYNQIAVSLRDALIIADYIEEQITAAEKRAAKYTSRIDVCGLCSHEDFGYCGLRREPIDLKYEYNEIGDLCKCSGFVCCKEYVERRFKIKRNYRRQY